MLSSRLSSKTKYDHTPHKLNGEKPKENETK
jgi:hypothetical protein